MNDFNRRNRIDLSFAILRVKEKSARMVAQKMHHVNIFMKVLMTGLKSKIIYYTRQSWLPFQPQSSLFFKWPVEIEDIEDMDMVSLIVVVICCVATVVFAATWIGLIIWICTREDNNSGISRRHPILLPHIDIVASNKQLETRHQTIQHI